MATALWIDQAERQARTLERTRPRLSLAHGPEAVLAHGATVAEIIEACAEARIPVPSLDFYRFDGNFLTNGIIHKRPLHRRDATRMSAVKAYNLRRLA